LAESDLFQIIKQNRAQKQNFAEKHVINFIWQITLALKTLKEEFQIRHRDLKPQNILKRHDRYYLGDFTTCKI
jgi:serine/threonine protein kinase